MTNNEIQNPIDKVIFNLFTTRWVGASVTKNLQAMRKQLYKNLIDQANGYWSGHTAYHLMVDGGFLKEGPRDNKDVTRLTAIGKLFIQQYEQEQDNAAV